MNVKEYAQKEDITIAEAKERTGLNHWNKQIPDEFFTVGGVAEPEETEEVAESVSEDPVVVVETEVAEPIIETESKQEDTEDLELIELSIRGIGERSPYWHLRHLLEK